MNSIAERIEEIESQRKRLALRGVPPSALLLWAKCHKTAQSCQLETAGDTLKEANCASILDLEKSEIETA
jgi:hypothetical protein